MVAFQRYLDEQASNVHSNCTILYDVITTLKGTWMSKQATFAVVRSMISREDTWHPRYGVMPGYGISLQDGFEDTFTATAMGALEMGAFPYVDDIDDSSTWFFFWLTRGH